MASHGSNKETHSEVETLSSHHFVPPEAVVDEEVGESVVEVGPQSHQPVSLVRVTDLPADEIFLWFWVSKYFCKSNYFSLSTDLNRTSASSRALLNIMLCW